MGDAWPPPIFQNSDKLRIVMLLAVERCEIKSNMNLSQTTAWPHPTPGSPTRLCKSNTLSRPCSIKHYPQKGSENSWWDVKQTAEDCGCDITLSGRYSKQKPDRPSKLTIRGPCARECFRLVCKKTREACIDLDKVKVVFGCSDGSDAFAPAESEGEPEDRVDFSWNPFYVGPMSILRFG